MHFVRPNADRRKCKQQRRSERCLRREIQMWRILRSLKFFGLGLAAFLPTVNEAASLAIRDDEPAIFAEGNSNVEPGGSIVLSFNVKEYISGEGLFVYVPVAVVPTSETLNPRPAALQRWIIYGYMIGTPQRELGIADVATPYQFAFNAPEIPGRYKVLINQEPVRRDRPLKTGGQYKKLFVPHTSDSEILARQFLLLPGLTREVATFSVRVGSQPGKSIRPIYLRVNGDYPGNAELQGGLVDHPITFSWYTKRTNRAIDKSILYRYKLEPQDTEWGPWTTQTEEHYSFLMRGVHQFRVQAKYLEGGKFVESPQAVFQFTLTADRLTRPSKESLSKGPTAPPIPQISFAELYPKSKALLIGVWDFDDAHFPKFDETKIAADLSRLEGALRKNGFDVRKLNKRKVSKDDILNSLAELIESSGRNDRLIVYFSTHGFPDPNVPSEAYLATSDCEYRRPTVRCVKLNDMHEQAQQALDGRDVRQILFAVDSCFSGLGVVVKSVGVPNLNRLAVPKGAFMLTAGMATQTAQIDPELGMSTFTHYLTEGLNGKADIMQSGVITLSELFIYVQFEVAKSTNSRQIPMLGKMRGDGEMLFLPKAGQP